MAQTHGMTHQERVVLDRVHCALVLADEDLDKVYDAEAQADGLDVRTIERGNARRLRDRLQSILPLLDEFIEARQ